MTLEEQYQEAVREIKRTYPGISDADADAQAREFVTPAGETAYATSELIDNGGFIGDPNVAGSNVFVPNAQPNRATGVVQLAGRANELPGNEPYMKAYQSDLATGVPEQEAELRNLHPYNEQEKHMALVRGAYGNVPSETVNELDKAWNEAADRYRKLVTQDQVDYQQADAVALEPVRRQSIELASEYKYREPTQQRPADLLSWVEKRQYSDAMTRLRSAEELLANKKKRMESLVSEATLRTQAENARSIIQALEAKAGGVPAEILTAGTSTGTGPAFREGQRVRNRRTGKMGTVRNGVVVPD